MSLQMAERRDNKRANLSCAVKLLDRAGQLMAESKTVNISDGGLMVTLPVDSLPSIGTRVNLEVALPRSTPSSFMLEKLTTQARVLRHQPMIDDRFAGAALRFAKSLKLTLDV